MLTIRDIWHAYIKRDVTFQLFASKDGETFYLMIVFLYIFAVSRMGLRLPSAAIVCRQVTGCVISKAEVS